MVCAVCKTMLEQHKNYRWKGTYDLSFDHHPTRQSLDDSAKDNCCICRVVLDKFKARPETERGGKGYGEAEGRELSTHASLSYDREWIAYRLDVKLGERWKGELVGSFFLKELREFVCLLWEFEEMD